MIEEACAAFDIASTKLPTVITRIRVIFMANSRCAGSA
jgi:hypothetical protein